MKTRYLIVSPASGPVGAPVDRLADAVLAAAGHDGYGAAFMRWGQDVDPKAPSPMRLFSSVRHIGNNPYSPTWQDRYSPTSDLEDDEAAKDEVAELIWRAGVLHSRFNRPGNGLEIFALEYDDAGVLKEVDGQPVEQLAQDQDEGVEAVRRYYDPSQ